MRKRAVFLVEVFLLLTFSALAQVQFSEVMYDFPGTDTKHEWVELYNSGPENVNLSRWNLREGNTNHALSLISGSLILGRGEYALIADDAPTFLSDYPDFSSSLYDSVFTSGLSNYGEELSLLNSSGKCIDNLTYDVSLGAAGNGATICSFNGTWTECLATPGAENKINLTIPQNNTNSTNNDSVNYPNLILTPYLNGVLYTSSSYDDLFKISINNKDNCSSKDTIVIEYNISGRDFFRTSNFTKEVGCSSYASTGEFAPTLAGEYLLCGKVTLSSVSETNFSDNQVCFTIQVKDTAQISCDVNLNINLGENLIYQQGQSLSYSFSVNNDSFPFSIEYWIEDLFGGMVKSKYSTTSLSQKTWKADISEEDRVLYLKAKLTPSCNDTNQSDNLAQKMFIVANKGNAGIVNSTNQTNDTSSISDGSTIRINQITPTSPEWGEMLKVGLDIYRGNTAKYVVYVRVEKNGKTVSEETKVNLNSKHTSYGLSLPVQLDSLCDEDSSTVVLVVEGLDQSAENSFIIEGNNCEEVDEEQSSSDDEVSSSSSATSSFEDYEEDVSYELVDLPISVYSGESLNFRVKIKGDEWDHFFQTYGYMYRGSRCYSCLNETIEREEGLQEFLLGYEEERLLLFSLPLDPNLDPGEYNLKVKFHKDGQITPYQLQNKVIVEGTSSSSEGSAQPLVTQGEKELELIPVAAKRTILNQSYFLVYESSSEKAKKVVPYLLAVVFGLIALVLIKKR